MVIVAGLFVISRLAARLSKGAENLGWDDYTIFAALVSIDSPSSSPKDRFELWKA